MPVVRIEDEFEVFEIDGEVIAHESTETDSTGRDRARWMEATVYRKDDGSYVIHQVNESVVWHLPDGGGHVRKPERIASASLDKEDVYCGMLRPRPGRRQCPRILPRPLPELVIAELPQHRVISCPDAPSVIREVSTARRGDGRVSTAVSEPMHKLITQAMENDPAFRGAKPVVAM